MTPEQVLMYELCRLIEVAQVARKCAELERDRLRGCVQTANEDARGAEAAADALRARIEVLEAALRPFVKRGTWCVINMCKCRPCVEWRAARAALEGKD